MSPPLRHPALMPFVGAVVALAGCAGAADAGGRPGEARDAGPADAGFYDAGTPADGGRRDAASPDAGFRDARPPADGGRRDAGPSDAGLPDAGPSDAGLPDAGPTVDPLCERPGCLRSVEALGRATRAELLPLVEPGVAVDNGYSIWRIRFATDGREARAVVTLPDLAASPAGGYAVAVNAPGTVGLADRCALGNGVGGIGLSGYFGARGFVGVGLDYPGLGTDGPHPYLVRVSEGRACLDAARAALALAAHQGTPTTGRVVVAGVSQGGHATIAAAMVHAAWAPELDVRAFAAVAPASAFLEQWAWGAAQAGSHLVYHALAIRAWALQYGHVGAPLFAEPLASSIDALAEERCLAEPGGGPTLFDAIATEPAAVFEREFLAAYTGADLSAYPAIARGFAENRLAGAFRQTAPLRIYQGTEDTTVLAAHTAEVVAALRADGIAVEDVSVEGGGHVDVAFGFLADRQLRTDDALAWLRAQVEE